MRHFKYIRIKKHTKFIKLQIFISFSEASEKKRNICDFYKFCVFLFLYIYNINNIYI